MEKIVTMLVKKGKNAEEMQKGILQSVQKGKAEIIDFLYDRTGFHYVRLEKIADKLINDYQAGK